jgi:hypothetical protein
MAVEKLNCSRCINSCEIANVKFQISLCKLSFVCVREQIVPRDRLKLTALSLVGFELGGRQSNKRYSHLCIIYCILELVDTFRRKL